MIEPWVKQYIGIPFVDGGRTLEGLDCWGLLMLVMFQQYNIILKDYPLVYNNNKNGEDKIIEQTIKQELIVSDWKPLDSLELATPGCGLLLRIKGSSCHVSLVVDKGWMLHIMEGIESCIEEYNNYYWERRTIGVYKHARL